MMDIIYTVLYTHQKTKKAKTWQDGTLKVLSAGTKAVLYDNKGSKLDALHIRASDVVSGEQLESDRYFIQVEEMQKQPTPPAVCVSAAEAQLVARPWSSLHSSRTPQPLPPLSRTDDPLRASATSSAHTTGPGGRGGLKRKRNGFIPPRVVRASPAEEDIPVSDPGLAGQRFKSGGYPPTPADRAGGLTGSSLHGTSAGGYPGSGYTGSNLHGSTAAACSGSGYTGSNVFGTGASALTAARSDTAEPQPKRGSWVRDILEGGGNAGSLTAPSTRLFGSGPTFTNNASAGDYVADPVLTGKRGNRPGEGPEGNPDGFLSPGSAAPKLATITRNSPWRTFGSSSSKASPLQSSSPTLTAGKRHTSGNEFQSSWGQLSPDEETFGSDMTSPSVGNSLSFLTGSRHVGEMMPTAEKPRTEKCLSLSESNKPIVKRSASEIMALLGKKSTVSNLLNTAEDNSSTKGKGVLPADSSRPFSMAKDSQPIFRSRTSAGMESKRSVAGEWKLGLRGGSNCFEQCDPDRDTDILPTPSTRLPTKDWSMETEKSGRTCGGSSHTDGLPVLNEHCHPSTNVEATASSPASSSKSQSSIQTKISDKRLPESSMTNRITSFPVEQALSTSGTCPIPSQSSFIKTAISPKLSPSTLPLTEDCVNGAWLSQSPSQSSFSKAINLPSPLPLAAGCVKVAGLSQSPSQTSFSKAINLPSPLPLAAGCVKVAGFSQSPSQTSFSKAINLPSPLPLTAGCVKGAGFSQPPSQSLPGMRPVMSPQLSAYSSLCKYDFEEQDDEGLEEGGQSVQGVSLSVSKTETNFDSSQCLSDSDFPQSDAAAKSLPAQLSQMSSTDVQLSQTPTENVQLERNTVSFSVGNTLHSRQDMKERESTGGEVGESKPCSRPSPGQTEKTTRKESDCNQADKANELIGDDRHASNIDAIDVEVLQPVTDKKDVMEAWFEMSFSPLSEEALSEEEDLGDEKSLDSQRDEGHQCHTLAKAIPADTVDVSCEEATGSEHLVTGHVQPTRQKVLCEGRLENREQSNADSDMEDKGCAKTTEEMCVPQSTVNPVVSEQQEVQPNEKEVKQSVNVKSSKCNSEDNVFANETDVPKETQALKVAVVSEEAQATIASLNSNKNSEVGGDLELNTTESENKNMFGVWHEAQKEGRSNSQTLNSVETKDGDALVSDMNPCKEEFQEFREPQGSDSIDIQDMRVNQQSQSRLNHVSLPQSQISIQDMRTLNDLDMSPDSFVQGDMSQCSHCEGISGSRGLNEEPPNHENSWPFELSQPCEAQQRPTLSDSERKICQDLDTRTHDKGDIRLHPTESKGADVNAHCAAHFDTAGQSKSPSGLPRPVCGDTDRETILSQLTNDSQSSSGFAHHTKLPVCSKRTAGSVSESARSKMARLGDSNSEENNLSSRETADDNIDIERGPLWDPLPPPPKELRVNSSKCSPTWLPVRHTFHLASKAMRATTDRTVRKWVTRGMEGCETGEMHKYGTGERKGYETGDMHNYGAGEIMGYDSGEKQEYETGEMHKYSPEERQEYETGEMHEYSPEERQEYETGDTHKYGTRERQEYETGDRREYGTNERQEYETGVRHKYGTGERQKYGTGDMHEYGTGERQLYETGDMHGYGTGEMKGYDTGAMQVYDTRNRRSPAPAPADRRVHGSGVRQWAVPALSGVEDSEDPLADLQRNKLENNLFDKQLHLFSSGSQDESSPPLSSYPLPRPDQLIRRPSMDPTTADLTQAISARLSSYKMQGMMSGGAVQRSSVEGCPVDRIQPPSPCHLPSGWQSDAYQQDKLNPVDRIQRPSPDHLPSAWQSDIYQQDRLQEDGQDFISPSRHFSPISREVAEQRAMSPETSLRAARNDRRPQPSVSAWGERACAEGAATPALRADRRDCMPPSVSISCNTPEAQLKSPIVASAGSGEKSFFVDWREGKPAFVNFNHSQQNLQSRSSPEFVQQVPVFPDAISMLTMSPRQLPHCDNDERLSRTPPSREPHGSGYATQALPTGDYLPEGLEQAQGLFFKRPGCSEDLSQESPRLCEKRGTNYSCKGPRTEEKHAETEDVISVSSSSQGSLPVQGSGACVEQLKEGECEEDGAMHATPAAAGSHGLQENMSPQLFSQNSLYDASASSVNRARRDQLCDAPALSVNRARRDQLCDAPASSVNRARTDQLCDAPASSVNRVRTDQLCDAPASSVNRARRDQLCDALASSVNRARTDQLCDAPASSVNRPRRDRKMKPVLSAPDEEDLCPRNDRKKGMAAQIESVTDGSNLSGELVVSVIDQTSNCVKNGTVAGLAVEGKGWTGANSSMPGGSKYQKGGLVPRKMSLAVEQEERNNTQKWQKKPDKAEDSCLSQSAAMEAAATQLSGFEDSFPESDSLEEQLVAAEQAASSSLGVWGYASDAQPAAISNGQLLTEGTVSAGDELRGAVPNVHRVTEATMCARSTSSSAEPTGLYDQPPGRSASETFFAGVPLPAVLSGNSRPESAAPSTLSHHTLTRQKLGSMQQTCVPLASPDYSPVAGGNLLLNATKESIKTIPLTGQKLGGRQQNSVLFAPPGERSDSRGLNAVKQNQFAEDKTSVTSSSPSFVRSDCALDFADEDDSWVNEMTGQDGGDQGTAEEQGRQNTSLNLDHNSYPNHSAQAKARKLAALFKSSLSQPTCQGKENHSVIPSQQRHPVKRVVYLGSPMSIGSEQHCGGRRGQLPRRSTDGVLAPATPTGSPPLDISPAQSPGTNSLMPSDSERYCDDRNWSSPTLHPAANRRHTSQMGQTLSEPIEVPSPDMCFMDDQNLSSRTLHPSANRNRTSQMGRSNAKRPSPDMHFTNGQNWPSQTLHTAGNRNHTSQTVESNPIEPPSGTRFSAPRKVGLGRFQKPVAASYTGSMPSSQFQSSLCGQLQFCGREQVENHAMPERLVVIPPSFDSAPSYKHILTAALTEFLNLQLFDVAKKFHSALSQVDLSGYTQGVDLPGMASGGCSNPVCKCNKASKVVQVKKDGANKGRFFYTCSGPREKQCKFFQWVDQLARGNADSRGRENTPIVAPKFSDPDSIMGYFRSHKLSLHCHCRLVRRCDNQQRFKQGFPSWVRSRQEDNIQKKRLFIKLPKKDSASLHAKDDLWVVSRTLSFACGETFVARSTFHGPNGQAEVAIEPLAGYSAAVWSDSDVCHALHCCNASTELTCMSNLQDYVDPTSLPVLPWLLGNQQGGSESVRSSKKGFKAPTVTQGPGKLHVPHHFVHDLSEEFIVRFQLNCDQASALRQAADMMNKECDPVPSLLLIHGVFGAGKSFLLSVLILFLVEIFQRNDSYSPGVPFPWKLLLSSTTNVAVDRVLMGLQELGFDDFVRVGSVKKIAKPVLPYSVHASGSESQELRDLQEMLKSSDITPAEKHCVRKSIEKHKLGENRKRLGAVRVVGVTCAACTFHCLDSMKFPFVVLDECSQMTEPASLLPIARFACEKLVLVGDPKQLNPTLQGSSAAHGEGLEQTLFDRLMKQGHDPVMLKTQYRCHPTISAVSNSLFYHGQLRDGIDASDRAPLLELFPTMCFYDVSCGQEQTDSSGSFVNEAEAQFVSLLLAVLMGKGLPAASVGVITLYKAQARRITDIIRAYKCEAQGEMAGVQVSTVDAFQGGERDVMILSCVRTGSLGFIDSDKRMNVALTRGRHHLLIVGHQRNLFGNKRWSHVISHCQGVEGGVVSFSAASRKLQAVLDRIRQDAADTAEVLPRVAGGQNCVQENGERCVAEETWERCLAEETGERCVAEETGESCVTEETGERCVAEETGESCVTETGNCMVSETDKTVNRATVTHASSPGSSYNSIAKTSISSSPKQSQLSTESEQEQFEAGRFVARPRRSRVKALVIEEESGGESDSSDDFLPDGL